ncbi:MAG TPA: glycoside hydrolase family 66 protein [Streptosporangiaceae bacterium]|nr:glycoside hydrolase family 66 protein [Streptosporangiaceae bacterium]
MNPASFPALKTWYAAGEPIAVGPVVPGTGHVLARSAAGDEHPAVTGRDGSAELPGLPPGTYAVEAWSADGELAGEELTTVGAVPGDRAVPGFVTSFRLDAVEPVLAWLRALRCTNVQFYDWMASYAEPLAATDSYADRLGGQHSLTAIGQLTDGCRQFGATPQAYAPVYAVDPDFGRDHPRWLLYRSDGEPQRLGELLQIANPGDAGWQRHWLAGYGRAADTLGFAGFHLDTYGYPRQPLDHAGRPAAMRAAYEAFLRMIRAARPGDVLSFNQVNGVPRDFELPGPPGFRYLEVWPPNDAWCHLEGLQARSSASSASPGASAGVLAIYPPVWSADRGPALRTALLTEAIATTLGASLLVWGDDRGCLQHPYYPDYQRLTADEAGQVLRWHRYALRCRDLFADGIDTSWTDIGDENGAVLVGWTQDGGADGVVRPEPAGGAVYARVVRRDDLISVAVLDLTGSGAGSWQAPTGPGSCRGVTVTILLAEPARWTAAAAVLGQAGDRFMPVAAVQRDHREGRALEIELPVVAGWSVLRLRRE